MREWQDVEFNGAQDIGPHLHLADGVIMVRHASLLGAMTRTRAEDWMLVASAPRGMDFSNPVDHLDARITEDVGFDWSAHVSDQLTGTALATLSIYLDESLLLEKEAIAA